MTHPLDNAGYASLTGSHAHLAERRGNVLRYPADVFPFIALPAHPEAADWADAATLAGPGAVVPLVGVQVPPPDDWAVVQSLSGVQMVDEGVAGAVDEEAVRLTVADVPEMLALADRAKPGPFLPRTIELGAYFGVRRDGYLVAMAGERLHPPGWTEISAVCTDVAHRGEGLATRLVRTLVAGIRARGETPFLHAVATNTNAIRLYESLGFRRRRTITFSAARVPTEIAA